MFEEVDRLVEERLQLLWNRTPIDSDNVGFIPTRGIPYIVSQINWANNTVIATGGRSRGMGILTIQIFVPANTGTADITEMADELAVIFDLWNAGYLRFDKAVIQRVGSRNEWYQINAVTTFKYDQCFVPS